MLAISKALGRMRCCLFNFFANFSNIVTFLFLFDFCGGREIITFFPIGLISAK